jgi:glycine hydroxymethyltransferase
LRIGTPAVTTRGMKENEMGLLANLLVKSIKNYKDKDELNRIREKVIALSLEFPLYPGYKMLK